MNRGSTSEEIAIYSLTKGIKNSLAKVFQNVQNAYNLPNLSETAELSGVSSDDPGQSPVNLSKSELTAAQKAVLSTLAEFESGCIDMLSLLDILRDGLLQQALDLVEKNGSPLIVNGIDYSEMIAVAREALSSETSLSALKSFAEGIETSDEHDLR
eukprot:ANDGO_00252.mRNA.1 hypothetical protein